MIEKSRLWAVAAYSNPFGSVRRRQNFQQFREALNVPLVVAELAPNGCGELAETHADKLLQVDGDAGIWQKERLLNLAIEAVPEDCEAIAWLDGDVIFDSADWAEHCLEALKKHVLLQPFSEYRDLGPNDSAPTEPDEPDGDSFGALIDRYSFHQLQSGWGRTGRRRAASGLAWVGRANVLRAHGLYDGCIMGNGDRAIVAAAVGECTVFADRYLGRPAYLHYRDWARGFHQGVKGRVGAIPGVVNHLWHGDPKSRRYKKRSIALANTDFTPARHLETRGQTGWYWTGESAGLQLQVQRYFAAAPPAASRAEVTGLGLSIFTVPRAWESTAAIHQTNSISSWQQLRCETEIFAFGDDAGTAEACGELGCEHLPEIARNSSGTPIIADAFRRASAIAQHDVLAYINTDILLLDDFAKALARFVAPLEDRPFLLIGRRTNLDLDELLDMDHVGWQDQVCARARTDGVLMEGRGVDYLVHSRGLFDKMPDFALGRQKWDIWCVVAAGVQGAVVLDATEVILAVHHNHSYQHIARAAVAHDDINLHGFKTKGAETEENERLLAEDPLVGPRLYKADYSTFVQPVTTGIETEDLPQPAVKKPLRKRGPQSFRGRLKRAIKRRLQR